MFHLRRPHVVPPHLQLPYEVGVARRPANEEEKRSGERSEFGLEMSREERNHSERGA